METATARQALEQTIGLQWAGWVGAIVLVIGAVLGIQFAYKHHWFAAVSPGMRLAVIFAAGLLLIGAGEAVFRRIHAIPAASLFGAGVATLFVGAYAGYAYFELYSRSTSMSLMAGSTLVGAAVAMRGNLVSIATLSLLGANVAPLLVATPNAPVVPFLFYLLMMQSVALFLASWGRGGKWWTLRGLSLAPTALWMAGVLTGRHFHEPAVLAFMLIYDALYHGELILATIRSAQSKHNPNVGSAFVICVTAALTLGVLTYFADASNAIRASWVVGLAAISAGLGWGLSGVHSSLARLGLSHRLAAAALLILSIPVATSGVRVEVGWMLLSAAFAVAWALTGSGVARYAAPVTWMLGLLRLGLAATGMVDGDIAGLGATWLTIWGTAVGSTAILAWTFAVTGHLIAALLPDDKDDHWLAVARLLTLTCGVVWAVAAIGGLPHLGATAWIIAYAWLLMAGDRALPRLNLAEQAGGVLLIAAVKWAVVDTLAARMSLDWATTRPVVNSMMGVGLLAAASLVGFYKLRRQTLWRMWSRGGEHDADWGATFSLVMVAAVIAMMALGLSFEIDRIVTRAARMAWSYALSADAVRQLSWTILWSAAVSALLLATAMLGTQALRTRWIGSLWILGSLLAVKFVVIDTLWQYARQGPAATPVLNLQFLAGLAVVGCLGMAKMVMPAGPSPSQRLRQVSWEIGMFVTALIAWMGTLEIDRAVMHLHFPQGSMHVAWHLKNLGWTAWWCIVAGGAMVIWWRKDKSPRPNEPWLVVLPGALALIAVKFLLVDAIFWRLMHTPPAGWPVLANPDVLTAAVVLGGLLLPCLLTLPASRAAQCRKTAAVMAVLVLLISGTLEVDRAFGRPALRAMFTDAELAEQVGLSIFWSIFAVVSLAVGFWKLVAPLRYFALGLLAATLVKVVVIDLGQVGYGYRVLSFLGLGLLLLGTSVMYGKVSPRLLRHSQS